MAGRRPCFSREERGRPVTRWERLFLLAAVALSLAAGWHLWGAFTRYHANSTESCLQRLHTDPVLCHRAGGLLDFDGLDATVCVFACTVPP